MRILTKYYGLVLGIVALMFLFPLSAFAVNHHVSIIDFAFTPLNSSIGAGDTVTWTNNSISPHTSTSDTRIWSSGVILPGHTFSHVFLTPGIFAYQCSIHVAFGMRDTIHVSATGVDDPGPTIPNSFELAQNYPNPFNAQTNINFTIYGEGEATLEIFDLLGQRIAVLVDQRLEPGSYSYTWNAGDKVSGVFFYRLTFDGQAKTQRMVLLK
jgi:plastocyanin